MDSDSFEPEESSCVLTTPVLPAPEEVLQRWGSSHTGLLNDFLEEIRGDTSTAEYHSVPALNPCALGNRGRTGQMATVRPVIAGCPLEMGREGLCPRLGSCSSLAERRGGGHGDFSLVPS